jgi:hypothetical protein
MVKIMRAGVGDLCPASTMRYFLGRLPVEACSAR